MKFVRGRVYVATVLLFVATVIPVLAASNSAYAAQITNRSLTLQTGAGGDGGSKPGGNVNHRFAFTIPTNTNLGSITFSYCTQATQVACVAPTGLSASAATFGGESGATGFSILSKTANTITISRASASSFTGAVTYTFNGVVNPSTANQTFFVRMSTFPSTDGTGTATDTGSVAASTANPIQLSGVMPESLIFCTGATVALFGNGSPDCSTATPGTVTFNQLFSPTDTATATSQMAASTNAVNGYAITINGPTLTSGSNTIQAMSTATTSARGSAQFGLNLKANTTATSTVAAGSEITPTSNGTDLRGQAFTGYNTVDTFKYTSGDVVANSANGGAGPTNSQRYTATYIANVPGSQPAGTYTTTLTYVCTPTF